MWIRASLVLFCMLAFPCFIFEAGSQSNTSTEPADGFTLVEEELPDRVHLRQGNRQFRRGSYYNALDHFEVLLERGHEDAEMLWKMALSHYYTRNYESTVELLTRKSNLPDMEAYAGLFYFYMGKSLVRKAQYQNAMFYLSHFLDQKADGKDASKKDKAKRALQNSQFAIAHLKDTLYYHVAPLDSGVNAPYTEFSPFVLGDSLLFYASINMDTAHRKEVLGLWTYTAQIYKSRIRESTVMPGRLLPQPINDPYLHAGHGSFTPDGKRFYFTRCVELQSGQKTCNVYRSSYQNENWSTPQKLEGEVNHPRHYVTDPFVTFDKDGRDLLFFSSDRPGGKGGLDIWYTYVNRKGETSSPVNAGSTINTSGDERSPFAVPGKGKLYFSSDGHPGFGGFDIFKTNRNWLKWDEVKNMGLPINSALDDMYFTAGESAEVYYLVSNRHGTMTLRGPTCCDDIFRVERKETPYTIVQFNQLNSEGKEADESLNVFVYEWGDHSSELLSTELKPHQQSLKLDKHQDYQIEISKRGYLPLSMPLFLTGTGVQDTVELDFMLEALETGRTYALQNVYFDFNEYALNEVSKAVLDDLYEMLKNNPDLVVELSSHTDDIGSDAFNMELSQKRAEACVAYLTEKGISRNRLVPKGYGASEPVAPNQLEDGSDNPEGRQQNRRTEFKILEKQVSN